MKTFISRGSVSYTTKHTFGNRFQEYGYISGLYLGKSHDLGYLRGRSPPPPQKKKNNNKNKDIVIITVYKELYRRTVIQTRRGQCHGHSGLLPQTINPGTEPCIYVLRKKYSSVLITVNYLVSVSVYGENREKKLQLT